MKKIRSFVIIAMLTALPVLLFSQPLPYQNGNSSTVGNTPVGAPIDGGLTILMLLGVGYGARKIYSIKKEKE